MPNSSSTPHILLELMLLRAQPPGGAGAPLDTSTQHLYQQAAAAASAGFDSSMPLDSSYDAGLQGSGAYAAVADADAAADAAEPQGDVELLVLVSVIRNMPLVPG